MKSVHLRAMKKQLQLNIYKGTNGGRRPKAGRPRQHSPGVSHSTREKVNATLPLHINFKYRSSIRSDYILRSLERGIENAKKHDFEVAYFTLQTNHVHIIAEAKNNKSLSSGMRAITVTLARALNKGNFQTERYHLHVLRTPAEVKNAIHYVLNNDLKHSGKMHLNFTQKVSTGKSWLLRSSRERVRAKLHSANIG